MFPSYDSQGLFHWELLYPAIQRGTVYHIDVLFPLHDCRYNLPCSVKFFSAKNYLQSSHYETKSATIDFFSSPPFLLLALSFSPLFFFVTVILELLGLKKPPFLTLFHPNDCKYRLVGSQSARLQRTIFSQSTYLKAGIFNISHKKLTFKIFQRNRSCREAC